MIGRVIAVLFPSVPPADKAIVLAAMEGREIQTPGAGACGEARPVPGQPEGGAGSSDEPIPVPSSGPPAGEDLLNWRAHPAHRWEFTDIHLSALMGRWREELA